MGSKVMMDFTIVENRKLHSQYSLLVLAPFNDRPLPEIKPGQFVQIAVDNSPKTFLRRPISVNFVEPETGHLWLLVRRAGEGTARIMEKQPGEALNLVLPLGNGFSFPECKEKPVLLIGGGVGVAPLLYFGRCLTDAGYKPEFLIGARSEADILELDMFREFGDVHIATDDGSAGEHGLVTQHSVLKRDFSRIYCCGPSPMMKAVAAIARDRGIRCEVSLENMMACGVGACLCCVEKTVKGNVCVCTEGPVFDIEQLTW